MSSPTDLDKYPFFSNHRQERIWNRLAWVAVGYLLIFAWWMA